MPTGRIALVAGAIGLVLVADVGLEPAGAQQPEPAGEPVAVLAEAPPIQLPGPADSNSPAVWGLVSGRDQLHILTSVAGRPSLGRGLSFDRLAPLAPVRWTGAPPSGGVWMESVIPDAAGVWFGYYHNERENVVCPGSGRVLPRIGAARSGDRGRTWRDLGPILEAPAGTEQCETLNRYFVGGVGDFTAILDHAEQYVYFFYSQYFEPGTGVSLARMVWANRTAPAGRVTVWNGSAWAPARSSRVPNGTGGTVTVYSFPPAAPFLRARDPWDDADAEVDVHWGPSIHWNTHLNLYVMLLNHAGSPEWDQKGVYVSFAPRLDDPRLWTPPVPLLTGGRWYPQVMGLDPGRGTDKEAGELARFFMSGRSDFTIHFYRQP